MIEIDGEFFFSPIEALKRERIISSIEVMKDASMAAMRAASSDSSIAIPFILEAAKMQVGAILSLPLFPNRYETGGVVVPINNKNKNVIIEVGGTEYDEIH